MVEPLNRRALFGEGLAMQGAPLSAQGFSEGKGSPFTAAEVTGLKVISRRVPGG
jgi:hypothetical protein